MIGVVGRTDPRSVELRLLVSCVRFSMYPETPGRNDRVTAGVNWREVLSLARAHRVIPLVHHALGTAERHDVPSEIWGELHDDFLAITAGNLFLSHTLLEVLELFGKHEIPALPYKGPVLAHQMYGGIHRRQYSDLDILVHKDDVLRARAVLLSLGYRQEFLFSPKREAAYLRWGCEYNFDSPQGVHVEVHWRIMPPSFPFSLEAEDLWDRATPWQFLGTPVLTVAPEDLLLILCVHASKHHWEHLSLCCDVAAVLRSCKDVDWDTLMNRSQTTTSKRHLRLGLLLARDVLGASLPPEIEKVLEADQNVESLARGTAARLLRDGPRFSRGLGRLGLRLRSIDRVQDRLRHPVDLFTVRHRHRRSRRRTPW